MSTVGIRSFVAEDRETVRDISYRTGFMGESAQSYWSHKESWADLYNTTVAQALRPLRHCCSSPTTRGCWTPLPNGRWRASG
jgi:hypothetical protein